MNMVQVRLAILKAVKNLLFHSPFRRYVLYRHGLRFAPEELCVLIRLIDETSSIPGDLLEVGCATGQTTVFLNRHLDARGDRQARYVCIDTFEGFTERDIEYEVQRRRKAEYEKKMRASFRLNDVKWFRAMLKLNRVERAVCVKTDIADYQFPPGQKFRFALLDVDIYKPTADALPKIFERLSPGGVIIVDDCYQQGIYDGSCQAFQEFVSRTPGATHHIQGKLGIIRQTA